jgi:CRISPR/Cas system CMR-associated protein Cmr5 small subunit
MRAAGAYGRVAEAAKKDAAAREDYGRVCRRLPSLILNAGLCQAVTFLEAKAPKKAAFGQALKDLGEIVDVLDLATKARTAKSSEYRRISTEALRCAQYLKRYAEAFDLGSDEDGLQ